MTIPTKCSVLTTKKKPCSRNAISGRTYCKQHGPKEDVKLESAVDPTSMKKMDRLRRKYETEQRQLAELHRKMLDVTLDVYDVKKKVTVIPSLAYLNKMKKEALRNEPIEMLLQEEEDEEDEDVEQEQEEEVYEEAHDEEDDDDDQ